MFSLDGTQIKAPQSISEGNSTQMAQNRTLDGSVNRDFFGSNKRIWTLEYKNTKKADYDTLKTIYTAYLANATAVAFVSDETNYTIASTNVHVDLKERAFRLHGTDYISDFTLTLIEA